MEGIAHGNLFLFWLLFSQNSKVFCNVIIYSCPANEDVQIGGLTMADLSKTFYSAYSAGMTIKNEVMPAENDEI